MADRSGSSVLVIDDEPDILTVVEYYVQSRNLSSDTFSQPDQALRHFEANRNRYGMVISDIKMPKMTGYDLAKSIRRLDSNIKIVLMSAFEVDQEEIQSAKVESKICDFIQKPFSIEQFTCVLDKHLSGPV